MKKQVCILTKSLKDNDYCVAGIDIKNGNKIVVPSAKIVASIPAVPYGERHLYYKFVAKIII